MDNSFFVEEMKAQIKMPALLRHYGFKLNKNRMPCCFHSGRDNNLGVKDNYYHCFVCGAKGDIIKFVQDYFGLSFPDALKKINDDFALGLPIGEKLDPKKQAEIARKRSKMEAAKQKNEAIRKKLDEQYWTAFDKWVRLDKNLRLYAPKSINDELHPLYIEAAQKLNYAEYLLDMAEIDRWVYKNAQRKT